MKINKAGTTIEYALANPFIPLVYLLLAPTDWKADIKPCNKCKAKKTNPRQYIATRQRGTNFS